MSPANIEHFKRGRGRRRPRLHRRGGRIRHLGGRIHYRPYWNHSAVRNDWWWPRRLETVKVIDTTNDLQTREINENRTLLYVFIAVVLIVLFILALRK